MQEVVPNTRSNYHCRKISIFSIIQESPFPPSPPFVCTILYRRVLFSKPTGAPGCRIPQGWTYRTWKGSWGGGCWSDRLRCTTYSERSQYKWNSSRSAHVALRQLHRSRKLPLLSMSCHSPPDPGGSSALHHRQQAYKTRRIRSLAVQSLVERSTSPALLIMPCGCNFWRLWSHTCHILRNYAWLQHSLPERCHRRAWSCWLDGVEPRSRISVSLH